MGLFDYVRSSYDLGPDFTNVELQTKDIEEGYSGTMTHFWIDPAGYLWCPDYKGTNTFEIIEKDDPRYNPKHLFLNYEWISTGQRGKYRVHPLTKYIEVYPSTWDGSYTDWPRCRIHFKYGKVMEYETFLRK
jgi:hypothetical protein